MIVSVFLLMVLLAAEQSQTTVVTQNVNVSDVTVETSDQQTIDVNPEEDEVNTNSQEPLVAPTQNTVVSQPTITVTQQGTESSVAEVEIRPTERVMKVKTEVNQTSTQVNIVPQSSETTLVKIASSSTSAQVEIKQTTEGPLKIETETVSATTSLPIKVVENQIQAEVRGIWETIIFPDRIKEMFEYSISYPTTIKKLELEACQTSKKSCRAIYRVELEGETSLLGIIKVHPTFKYDVEATSGEFLKTEKPWYLRFLSFLFT